MGHRAEKARLRHGFASGERPPTPGSFNPGASRNKTKRWYQALKALTGSRPPKIGFKTEDGSRKWSARHVSGHTNSSSRE